jgi:hypothetical protein
MKENLFMKLSNKDLQDCYHSYIRVQCKREVEEKEVFSNYIDEYIWMLENNGTQFKYYDEEKKYNIGFSITEKDMLYAMARRYLKLCRLINEFKPFFGDGMEAVEYMSY